MHYLTRPVSALEAGGDVQGLQEVLLREQEQQQGRDDGHAGGRHQGAHLVVLAHLVAQQLQTSGDRHLVDVVEHQGRPQEVVPSAGEAEQEDDDQNRADGRQHDAGEDLEISGAVDFGRLVQFLRDALHEVAHQEDVRHVAQARDDAGPVGVDPAEGGDDAVLRDHVDHGREHRDEQQDEEQRIAVLEVQTGIAEACERDDAHGQHCEHGRDNQRVAQPVERFRPQGQPKPREAQPTDSPSLTREYLP